MIDLLKFVAKHPLTSDDRIRSIARVLKWQIGSRLVPGAVVFEWVNGSKFLVRSGEAGLTGNIYAGLHEFTEMGYLLHVLRDEDFFVDVGANVGSYTILACAAVGARGLAIEPVPNTYARLVENVRINHLEDRVTCLNVGVGKEPGYVSFTSGMDTSNHVVASSEESNDAIRVEIRTLDDALRTQSATVMKMDIEGYETPALEGAQETLRNPALHSVIMELNGSGTRYGYDETRLIEMMIDHGFRSHSYDPLKRSLTELSGRNGLSGRNPVSDNMLFVRNPGFVAQRLASAHQVKIFGKAF
jgi:FkbM family methyltransferase